MTWEERFPGNQKQYGGLPFWAWNCKVERDVARRQIGYFDEMGMGGFVIHSRTGLELPYLGREFMDRVRECVREARDREMKVWLYDEDRWPSGFAGGLVTENREYRARYLVLTPVKGGEEPGNSRHKKDGRLDLIPQGDGRLRGTYAILFQDGRMVDYREGMAGREGEETWYLYEEEMKEDAWFNHQTYMDTLNRDAVNRFLEITYEAYERELGDAFGREVTAIFTDEPQFVHKRFPEYEGSKEPVILPCTAGMEDEFERRFGFLLLERLPELVWDTGDDRSGEVRYCVHRFLGELLAETYCDVVGEWCKKHGIGLTGHMKGEDTLQSQAASLGEVMRQYYHFQIPGVDVLCDKRLYSTVKQAQSVSRQMGRNQVASEEYGVTNWDFDFVGHKLQGDWQAALGVTSRVHHLAWMSMEGEAKRDFPASIFYQSPWYREYATLERYFGRIRMAMETGTPVVHIGVIHPIESYWMVYGGTDHQGERNRLETCLKELMEWLLFGLMDFDFISEALLEKLPEGEDRQQFGAMRYQVILVPDLLTLRKSTLERLQSFQQDGGTVLFSGRIPEFIEGRRSWEPEKLARRSFCLKMDRNILLGALEPYREVEILDEEGRRSDGLLYQLRKIGSERWLFVANGRKPPSRDKPKTQEWNIMVKGDFQTEFWNAMNGTVIPCQAEHVVRENRIWTMVRKSMTDQDSLLIRLEEEKERVVPKDIRQESTDHEKAGLKFVQSLNVDSVICEEPNVLMLDQAWYRLDEGEWQNREEVLRIENRLRNLLGFPPKQEAYAQPWVTASLAAMVSSDASPPAASSSTAVSNPTAAAGYHTVTIKFEITARTFIHSPALAVEHPEEKNFFWNGTPVPVEDTGFYVDESIRTIRLPEMPAGTHQLQVTQPFHQKSSLEWMYLLGDFGVNINKCEPHSPSLVPKPASVSYGSLTSQGLPFYGGNVIYQSNVNVEEGEYVLEVTTFRAPLLGVTVDGVRVGIIAFAPYRLNLGFLSGEHDIGIISFGNRINTFGPVHNCDPENTWFGPGAWRTAGEKYSYAYQLKETGILKAPKLFRI